ncbi:MAG: methionine--tRNA ligase [Chloroflexota bacterium]
MTTQPLQSPYYITTAIAYVNAKPHLGYALELILTDAVARYHRLNGRNVRFLTGTDENSLKNVRAALQEDVPTDVLVQRNADQYQALKETLSLSFDDFIRTSSDSRHQPGVEKLWRACVAQGDIYTRPYRGLYCVGCEQFYNETELVDGLCPEHQTPPELVEETNYFFRLSRYADQLEALIASDTLQIVPDTRKKEVLTFIRSGLQDFSISRSRARAHGWGIPVPDDPEQVIYVWFDALSNYITALDYAVEGDCYQTYWHNNPQRIHVIGKGITRFHAIYWPAMLLSAGVPLPTTLFVHGYITLNGGKISKSLGNTVDPVELVEAYGLDAVRYYLLREIKATEDGDFTCERFIQTYNTDLANQLGNLLSRFIGMVNRYYEGRVPTPSGYDETDQALIAVADALPQKIEVAIARFAVHEALTAIWDLIAAANKYVVTVQPWHLAKQRFEDEKSEARLGTSLYNLAEILRLVAYHCSPFLPTTAAAINDQLNIVLGEAGTIWGGYPAETVVQANSVLFPKIE